MADIFDYLYWRKDLSFKAAPFNEIDSLILSNLAYIHFNSIVNEEAVFKTITIGKAADLFLKKQPDDKLYRDKRDLRFIEILKDAPRFKGLKLYYYQENYDHEKETQFAAVSIRIKSGLTYVAFRGTDGFLAGWKENFNSSFAVTKAQKSAVRYLNKTASLTFDRLIVGGHSKGGNLAVFASAYADKKVQKRIVRIYNNDGPGFNFELVSRDKLDLIKDKLITFTPSFSIVAMIMEQISDPVIIASNGSYVMQHDPYSWQIEPTNFKIESDYDKFSKVLHKTMDRWLASVDIGSREIFIDAVYEIITVGDSRDLNVLAGNIIKNLPALLKRRKGLDEKTVKILNDSISELITALKESIFQKNNA